MFATTAAPADRYAGRALWDESTRPVGPPPPAGQVYSARARAVGRHLVDVHDHLRAELTQLRDIMQQVRAGVVSAGAARAAVAEMTLRQNNWTMGAYCASYCRLVTEHHGLEDASVFPHLRRADAGLGPVLDRLAAEHVVIHGVLDAVDRSLVGYVDDPADFSGIQAAVDDLSDTLLSHLAYEEQQLVEPLARYGFFAGQV